MYNQHYDTVKGKHEKLRFHGIFSIKSGKSVTI